MEFEWNPDKDLRNQRKHGIGFADAVRMFEAEDRCLDIYDDDHSETEERFITIGPVEDGLALVVWTELEFETVRRISARWATSKERQIYYRHMESER